MIPRSRLSSDPLVPNVIIGSATSTTVELTVVVVPDTVKLPSITALPVTSKFPPTFTLLVAVATPVIVNVDPSNVKFPLSSNSPAVPANTTRPLDKSLTLALAKVVFPALNVPETVALLLNSTFPPTVAPAVTTNPLPDALLNVNVSLISAVLFASIAPLNVANPDAVIVEAVVAPVTANVPAIAVLPVASATVNLLLSTAIPAFALRRPLIVVTPVTPNVPPTVDAPVTVSASPIVTSSGNPIVNVSVALTAVVTSFAVPLTTIVSPLEIVCEEEPSDNVQPVEDNKSTYALVAASCADVGSVTFETLFDPALIV